MITNMQTGEEILTKCEKEDDIYLEALNQISDICTIKENHGATLTGIIPIQKIIGMAHKAVLDLDKVKEI